MEQITLRQIKEACSGKFFGDSSYLEQTVSEISIDSRTISPNSVFVAIIGAQFDGHDFIENAYQKGAIACISQYVLDTPNPYILVESTQNAYRDIAGYYRSLFDIPVVGITGSAGKTTSKELVASVLSQKYCTLKNKGSLNNQTGTPTTLLGLTKEHEAAVIEMGTNHFGEIDFLAKAVSPTICAITNIGEAHIEHFKSKEGTLKAKSEMFLHRKEGASIILNGDDPYLKTLKSTYPNAILYGTSDYCDIMAYNISYEGFSGTTFCVNLFGKQETFLIPYPGTYMLYNALLAISIGTTLGMNPKDIQQGLTAYTPPIGRMRRIETPRFILFDDCYNANPSSMMASIDIAALSKGRSVLILGDMYELGENSPRYHYEVGAHAAEKNIGLILCVGELAKEIYNGALQANGTAKYFKDVPSLTATLKGLLSDGDTILLKASHGMHLERVLSFLREL